MKKHALSFRTVSFGYHNPAPILRDVDFSLRAGKVTAVLGPNGVGKSTLLALALGWLTPWEGEIRIGDQPLNTYPQHLRGQRMALVPQTEHTPFDYTVLEYVLLGRAPHLPALGRPRSEDFRVANRALKEVGLSHLTQRAVPQLSGGERQLMLLARAITQITAADGDARMYSTRLLLLDEPTAHLDLANKARIIGVLRRLRAQGVSLLMTNHEPEIVFALADDVLLLEGGTAPQFGALEDILTEEALSRIYQLPIRIVEVEGSKQILWT